MRWFTRGWAAGAALLWLLLIGAPVAAHVPARAPVQAASELDYPPFASVDGQGEADGFAVELMRAALAAMGRPVQFRVGPWHLIKEDLAAGRVEALPLVARSAARDRLFDFSVPYLTMHGVIVVRRGDSRIRSRGDLRNKSVLVMRGDIAEEYVREHQLSDRIVTTETAAEALARLARGEQDAVVMQKLVARNLMEALSLSQLEMLDPPLEDYQTFSFAVREDDNELLAVLNEGLALVVADGTYDRLRRKWMVPVDDTAGLPLLPILAAAAGALLFAAAVAWLWQRSLVKMVRLRTAELSRAHARIAESEALRESEERLRLAAQSANFGTFDIDLVEHRAQFSDELKAIAGLAPREEIGLGEEDLPQFLHPGDRGRLRAAFRAAKEGTGAPFEEEYRMLRPDGTLRRVRLTGRVLFAGEAAHRQPLRLVGTLVDITERREAEEKFRALVEQALAGIYIIEGESLRYANPLAVAMHGYASPEELIGRVAVADLIAPADRERMLAAIRERLTGDNEELHQRYLAQRRDGTTFVAEVHGRRFDYQGRPALIGILLDITERTRAEETLARNADELKRINAELEEFAYVASHDLKAPLRAVANLATVIAEDAGEQLDEENRGRLRLLRERMVGMDRLIDGLLRYARLGRTPREAVQVALGPLLSEMVGELALPAGFRVVWESLPTLTGDPLELRQIFQNLIANAVHHHDRAAGTVWVRAAREAEGWRLEVADDGPGIPPERRSEMFRMFSTGSKSGHSGIGLAVVRKLVLANGGQVEILDHAPRGALFRIFWPEQGRGMG